MVHIEYELLNGYDFQRISHWRSTFISFKKNEMWHSLSRQYREVAADAVYGGSPAPYTVTVEDMSFAKTDLLSGKTGYAESGYDFLTEGPKAFNWILGDHVIICRKDTCPYEIDEKKCFSSINQTTRLLLRSLVFQPHSNTFLFRPPAKDFPREISIVSGAVKAYDSYSWKSAAFSLNGQSCSFEDLLRWSVRQKTIREILYS